MLKSYLLAAFLAGGAQQCWADGALVLGATVDDRVARSMAERVLREAYRRAGIAMQVTYLPTKRRLLMVRSGQLDGMLAAADRKMQSQVADMGELIMLVQPVAYEDIVVFSAGVAVAVQGYATLAPYSVGMVAGTNFAAGRLQVVSKPELAYDIETLLKKLAHGRNELAVDLRSSYCTAQRLGLHGIRVLEPPLETQQYFHYLHQRHQAIADKIAFELNAMQVDGSLRRLQDDAAKAFWRRCVK